MPTHIYGYFENLDDFRSTTIKSWRRAFTTSAAKKYLRNHLLQSLKNDFSAAYPAFKRRDTGYFALPRIIFPYISFLGCLYKGSDTTDTALAFIIDYMGRVSPVYKLRAGIDYLGYRNGLMHTHMPKIFSYGKRKLGWRVSYANVTTLNRDDRIGGNLLMYPKLFYKDLCMAIELYISDFDDSQKQLTMLNNFVTGYITMAALFKANDVRASKLAKNVLRAGLKRYAL